MPDSIGLIVRQTRTFGIKAAARSIGYIIVICLFAILNLVHRRRRKKIQINVHFVEIMIKWFTIQHL